MRQPNARSLSTCSCAIHQLICKRSSRTRRSEATSTGRAGASAVVQPLCARWRWCRIRNPCDPCTNLVSVGADGKAVHSRRELVPRELGGKVGLVAPAHHEFVIPCLKRRSPMLKWLARMWHRVDGWMRRRTSSPLPPAYHRANLHGRHR